MQAIVLGNDIKEVDHGTEDELQRFGVLMRTCSLSDYDASARLIMTPQRRAAGRLKLGDCYQGFKYR